MDLYQQEVELLGQKAAILHKLATIYIKMCLLEGTDCRMQLNKAECLWRKSLNIKENIGELKSKGTTLCQLASIYYSQNKFPEAINLYNKCIEIQQRIGDREGIADMSSLIANLLTRENCFDEAFEHYQEAFKIYEYIDRPKKKVETLLALAKPYAQNNQVEEAIKCYKESCEIAQSINYIECKASALTLWGQLLAKQKSYETALERLEAASTIFMKLGSPFVKNVNKIISEVQSGFRQMYFVALGCSQAKRS